MGRSRRQKCMTGSTKRHTKCLNCSLGIPTYVTYSMWWYCDNPKDFRDFTIINRDSNSTPTWCLDK